MLCLGSTSSVSCMCMCVCTAVGMCSPSVLPLVVSTWVRALYSIWHGGLGSVRSIHECYLHVCTVLVQLERHFGVASTGGVPILPDSACTYVLYLYHCTLCNVRIPLVQCFGMASTGSVPILPVFVLVMCLTHCIVCTVLVPLVQCFGMASTGNVPILPVLILALCLCHYTVCTVLVTLWHGQHGQCTYLARACTHTVLVSLHSVYCACTSCTVFGMASKGNVPVLLLLVLDCACTIAQCVLCLYPLYSVLALPARAMYLPWLCLHVRTVLVLL